MLKIYFITQTSALFQDLADKVDECQIRELKFEIV